MTRPLILIPARMHATRLPGKPLAGIAGKPMILHVWERAVAANAGDVAVATDTQEIATVIERAGGRAVMTRADHPSGSDRIFEALTLLDPERSYDTVINLQGDMPTIDPGIITRVLEPLKNPAVDIATLAAVIRDEEEREDPAVVKAVLSAECCVPHLSTQHSALSIYKALYFSRSPVPAGDGPLYHHIGIYAYRRPALERFVALPPSPLEQREKLEQLRALEAGMRIDVSVVDTVPLGVDTPQTLEKARAFFV